MQQQQQQNLLLPPGTAPGGVCWKSTPDAAGPAPPPPRLSLSAILPLSAMATNPQQQQRELSKSLKNSKKQSKKSGKRRNASPQEEDGNVSERTVLPGACAGINPRHQAEPEPSLAKLFFSNPRVRRSLAIDSASVLIFVPLSIITSVALMRLFQGRMGADNLEWHHYLLVGALASLVLIPICRVIYSCCRYRRRIIRMRKAAVQLQKCRAVQMAHRADISRSRRALDTSRAQDFQEFANMVARQQNLDLSMRRYNNNDNNRSNLSALVVGGDRSNLGNISGISCHRPDISMAAYNC